MTLCELPRGGDADCAHRYVHRVGPQGCEQAGVAERHGEKGGVVADHGEHRVRVARRVGRRGRDGGACAPQRLGTRRAAVEHAQRVSGREQVGGHRAAHGPEADESDLHEELREEEVKESSMLASRGRAAITAPSRCATSRHAGTTDETRAVVMVTQRGTTIGP
jgi:hypothetical protein